MTDLHSQFAQAIHDARMKPPAEIIADGELHRFATRDHDDAGWYVLHDDGIPAGMFGDWRTGDVFKFRADIGRELTPEEQAAHRIKANLQEQLRQQERDRQHAEAATEAARVVATMGPAEGHPYLSAKGIQAHAGIGVYNGNLIVPYYDGDTLTTYQQIDANGRKRLLKGGRKLGAYHTIGNALEALVIVLAEGYATGASVHEATGLPVAVCHDAGNMQHVATKIKSRYPGKRLIIAGDNDASGTGQKAAREAAEVSGGSDLLPPEPGDWNDYATKHGADAIRAVFDGLPTEPDPVDPFGALEAPPLDLDLLPEVLRDYVADQSDLMGSDPGMFAMFAIAAVTAALDDRLRIQPKRYDDSWTESPRLWIAMVGDPSTMKSPALANTFNPIRYIDARNREEYQRELATWEDAKEKTPKGEKPPPAPIQKRISVTDATVEKLADILSKQEKARGITAIHDELSGWLASMDVYKATGVHKDRAAWLTAYNGGSLLVDRVNRGSLYVENFSVSVVGGIQPTVLHSYMKATDHDGMLPRFLIYWANPPRTDADRPPDVVAKRNYQELIQHLYHVTPGDVVQLSEAAHVLRENFNEDIRRATRNADNPLLQAALSKWRGTFARLALVLHCIDCAMDHVHPTARTVSEETAQRTAGIMGTILLHSRKFYSGIDPTGDTARDLAALILAHGWDKFTVKRDFSRYWKASRRMSHWEIENALDRLDGYGWITPNERLNERGRPTSYVVNPRVHKLYAEHAERERARREERREELQLRVKAHTGD